MRERLLSFFPQLGGGEASEELRRIDELLDELSPLLRESEKQAPQKMKIGVTLGICTAAVLLLMFL